MAREPSGAAPAQIDAAQPVAANMPVTALPDGSRTLSGRGEIYSFGTMFNVPRGFEEQRPYTIAIIRLDDGPMVTAQLTDVDAADVHIGLRVEMVTRKLREDGDEGQIVYGYKFRPVLVRE
ncbi:MAG: Zn-ribbon domain-containing OB-fold protein [Caldilineaceae bacterium]